METVGSLLMLCFFFQSKHRLTDLRQLERFTIAAERKLTALQNELYALAALVVNDVDREWSADLEQRHRAYAEVRREEATHRAIVEALQRKVHEARAKNGPALVQTTLNYGAAKK